MSDQHLAAAQKVMPLEVIDKCTGSRVWVLMKDEKEMCGTLLGFDDFVNMVLKDVVVYGRDGSKTRRDTILLNGNNISVMVPGKDPEDE